MGSRWYVDYVLRRSTKLTRGQGETPGEKDRYEQDAKLLITLWGLNGEISDYSCRIWSGLIGSYYVPRWQMYFENLAGAHYDIDAWERRWVRTVILKWPQPFVDPTEAAKNILKDLQITP